MVIASQPGTLRRDSDRAEGMMAAAPKSREWHLWPQGVLLPILRSRNEGYRVTRRVMGQACPATRPRLIESVGRRIGQREQPSRSANPEPAALPEGERPSPPAPPDRPLPRSARARTSLYSRPRRGGALSRPPPGVIPVVSGEQCSAPAARRHLWDLKSCPPAIKVLAGW